MRHHQRISGDFQKTGGHLASERKSILAFLVLTFALSVPFWIVGSLFKIQLLPGLPIAALAAFTPSIAAFIMVFREARYSSVRSLLSRSHDAGRIGNKKWYFVFVLFNPVVALLSFLVMRSMGVAVPNPASLTLAVVPLCAIFFIAALGEEIGWTGYVTEPLLRRWGILLGGGLLGSVWVVFHLIPLAQIGRSIEWIAWRSLGTLSLRIIMFWLFAHAGSSIVAAAIFHATINLVWQLFPINGSFYDPRLFSLFTLALGLCLFIAYWLFSRIRNNST